MTSRIAIMDTKARQAAAEENLLDDALARIGRLEAALAATGGVLHDVNNLLTVLSGNLYLLTEAARDDPELLRRCRTVRNTADRAGSLIRELLSAARESGREQQVISPARHVEALDPLIRRVIGSKHTVEIVSPDARWSVLASPTQFESAVTNLVLNAREALKSAGKIRIRTENVTLDAHRARKLGIVPGDFVCVQVSDTGVGIPADKLPRITSPAYTSKPAGRGGGLGLAMVQRFVTGCGGRLRIDSVEGRGTTVQLWLPRSDAPVDATANLTLPLSTLPSGSERVLLLTGDPDVGSTIEQLLTELGYEVHTVRNRREAASMAREKRDFALLMSDRSAENAAPDRQLLGVLKKMIPKLRHVAILAPGVRESDAAIDADACLHCPIAIAELAHSVRKALEK